MKLDTRQRYSLFKAVEPGRRSPRETDVIILCDLLDKTLPTFNPDFCTRQSLPVATELPELIMRRVEAAFTTCRHEEKTVALCERLLTLQPTTGQKPPDKMPDKPDKVADKITRTSYVPKKATPSKGRPRSQTPSAEAERKRKAREKKKAALDQLLKGQGPRK